MFFSNSELDKHIRRRPSVQIVCLGAFLQQPIFVTDDVLAVPLSSVGCRDLAELLGSYVSMDLDIHISVDEVDALQSRWKETSPGVVLVWQPVCDASTEELERGADRSFAKAKRNLCLITGDRIDVAGTIVLHEEGQEFKLYPPRSKRRQRLWVTKDEALIFQENVVRLAAKSETDSRISLALQMYLDAVNERSEEFKIVKLYNVLECLSSALKGKDENGNTVGSRDAVRKLLNVTHGQHWVVEYKGLQVSFDLVAVSGKFRDVLMHGSKVEKNTFAVNDRGILDVLAYESFKIADELHRVVDDMLWKIASQPGVTVSRIVSHS